MMLWPQKYKYKCYSTHNSADLCIICEKILKGTSFCSTASPPLFPSVPKHAMYPPSLHARSPSCLPPPHPPPFTWASLRASKGCMIHYSHITQASPQTASPPSLPGFRPAWQFLSCSSKVKFHHDQLPRSLHLLPMLHRHLEPRLHVVKTPANWSAHKRTPKISVCVHTLQEKSLGSIMSCDTRPRGISDRGERWS